MLLMNTSQHQRDTENILNGNEDVFQLLVVVQLQLVVLNGIESW
jgi:hypothetical protein